MIDKKTHSRCLILACGNPSRGDDGAAWRLAEMAAVAGLPEGVRLMVQQQWTPELAEDLAGCEAVLFVDCSVADEAGAVTLTEVRAAEKAPNYLTHHMEAPGLLRLAAELYGEGPERADLLVIGGESLGYTEDLSPAVEAALPRALELLRNWAATQACIQ